MFAYTGALGMKQDSELILELAIRHRDRDDVRVLVLSGGPELDYLRGRSRELGLGNLVLREFVPWDQLPDVLGASDILIALVHRDAGRYSVPSKVLSYLCAGRPLLVSVPTMKLAGRIRSPQRESSSNRATRRSGGSRSDALRPDEPPMGSNGRRYAESTFAIEPIADRTRRF